MGSPRSPTALRVTELLCSADAYATRPTDITALDPESMVSVPAARELAPETNGRRRGHPI
ncbi:hypothetical protein ACWEQ2_06875 [Streptomyces sp. NPDC004096]|uniref:hypothetical protein n=1 Tax=unclassified Streptomyces TaxID=2593676 RepID=UPI0033A8C532